MNIGIAICIADGINNFMLKDIIYHYSNTIDIQKF